MIAIAVVLGILCLLVIWAIAIYNGLVRLKNLVEEGWSGIDVQLKKRANLIPNLVEAVKGYMGHEKDVLTKVTELRARSMSANAPAEKAQLEAQLSRALAQILAVAEQYPDLKANENFIDLQTRLTEVENEIQMARRYYNGTVRNLNIKIESFPSNIVAGVFGFEQAEFFELEDEADRQVPDVSFT